MEQPTIKIKGENNPNFTFDKLEEQFQEEARKWMPMIEDDREILYCYQPATSGGAAIVVFWDKRDSKLNVIRMFELGDNIATSMDLEKEFTVTGQTAGSHG